MTSCRRRGPTGEPWVPRALLAYSAHFRGGGQLEPERRAFVLDALEADPTSVRLHDLARHSQSEADTGDPACLGLAAEELGEDARLVLRRDAEALVLDEHPRDVAVEPA